MKFLFDLGGIFFDWNPRYFYNSIFSTNKEMEYFLNNICNDEWNLKQDSGRIIKDAEEELISSFPKYSKQIKMYYRNHRRMIGGTYQCSIDTLLNLKSLNYLCYILSNWSAETFVGMEDDYPFLKLFDGKIISGNENMIKPDKEIFNLAILRFDLMPENTIFIDDRLENVETAKKMGFKTIHLLDPKRIDDQIKKLI